MKDIDEQVWEQCQRDLAQLKSAGADSIDSAPTGMLDVLCAYRLLLGRRPEFTSLEAYRQRTGGLPLKDFVHTIIESAEFRLRHLEPPSPEHHRMVELLENCRTELGQVGRMSMAERVDHFPAGVLDVLWGYRLLLGRWPEYTSVEEYRRQTANASVSDLVKRLIDSVEFRSRHTGLEELDLEVLREMPEGFKLYFNLNDRQSIRIAAGVHEPEIRQAIQRVLQPGMNCIDIGAHIGLYSVLMGLGVRPAGGRVWAFEPHQRVLPLLRKNLSANGLESTVVLTEAGCFNRTGRGRMCIPDASDLGPVWMEPADDDTSNAESTVPLVRVDDIVPAGVKIGLVKMDIEGNEPFAFDGMQRIIRDSQPILFTEFIPGALGLEPKELLGRLSRAEYRIYEVSAFLEQSHQTYEYRPGSPPTNLVCLPG